MADQIEAKSLVSLASFKGGELKTGGAPDARTRLSVVNATRNSSFDGFLNTFLGRSPGSDSPGGAKRSGTGPSSASSAAAGGGMKAAEKESLKKSMDKTVSAEEGGGGEGADGDVAAAAEEAAVLIWNLIYGYGGGGAMPGSMPDSLRRLAGMLNSGGGTGAGGLGLDLVQGAIETANASAEMNSAAILASVDDLLEGMPRHVLDDALARMSGRLGLPTSGFEGVLAMLKGSVISTNTRSGADMLGMLSASATTAAAAAANSAIPAENAGETALSQTLDEALQDFLSEKIPGNGEAEDAEELANDFVKWLKDTGKTNNIKGLSSDNNKAFEDFVKNAFGNSNGKNQDFPEIIRNLEKTLQLTASSESAGDSLSGNSGNSQNSGQNQSAALTQPNSVHPGQAANVQNAHTTSMASMLERMENIERLSEAMKMATKGGVNNITMQLAPAEMGRLVLKVESRNGVVSAKLKVEKREAAEQLGASIHELKESLEALGIELGEVEIEHRPPSDLYAELSSSSPVEPDAEERENEAPLQNLFA